MAEQQLEQQQRQRSDRWLLIVILFLFLCGLGIRGYAYMQEQQATLASSRSASPHAAKALPDNSGASSFQPGNQLQNPGSESQPVLFSLAPYLTEGGLSFFLGFCVGAFLRVAAKTVAIVIGGVYCVLILLSHYGVVAIDWGMFQQIIHQFLLNTQPHLESLQHVVRASLPSAAMGGLGIWRGLKKS